MKSYQNLLLLRNLYRLKALGYDYIDPVTVNVRNDDQSLPNNLDALHHLITSCHLCDLSKSRSQAMPGIGSGTSGIMIVNDAVSMAEDESANWYAGRSGSTLKKMVENVLERSCEEVYLTHAVKCKPSGSNRPSESEWSSCKPYLFKQIELMNPKVIIALGPDAYQLLTGDTTAFEQVRGQQIAFGERHIVPMYHPSYLLRNPSQKRVAMNDLHTIKGFL